MKVQTVATMYVERNADGSMTRHRRGETFELDADEGKKGIESGLLREPSDSELPPPNAGAVDTRPTQPDGTPIDEDVDGNPLSTAGQALDVEDWRPPRNHRAADKELAALGIATPKKAKLPEKVQAIQEYRAAQAQTTEGAAPVTPPTTLDLSEQSDDEIIQLGIDSGLTEEELVELSHDELVLRVAEAVNLRTDGNPALEDERLGAQPDVTKE